MAALRVFECHPVKDSLTGKCRSFSATRFCPIRTYEITPIPQRQELPPSFHREGSVYVTRRNVVMEENSLYGQRVIGHIVDADMSVNIDGPEDWKRAEGIIERVI